MSIAIALVPEAGYQIEGRKKKAVLARRLLASVAEFVLLDAGRVQLGGGLDNGAGSSDFRLGLETIVAGLRFFAHVGQPVAWRLTLARRDFEEHLLNLLGDFAALAVADGNAIYRTNRCDLGGRTAEEHLVRDIERCALNAAFLNRQSQFVTNLNHAVARDTGQH